MAQTNAPTGGLKSLPASPVVIPPPLLPNPTNAPVGLANASDLAHPEVVGGLPQIWTYIAVADLAAGANLRDVFAIRGLNNIDRAVSSKQLGVKMLVSTARAGWAKFPDAIQDGQEMMLVQSDQAPQLRFYAKMSHYATLDTRTLHFVRGAGALWQNAAVGFKDSESTFQVVAVDRQVSSAQRTPWPIVTLPSDRWLTATGSEAFQVTIRPELLAQLRLRSVASPFQTPWRLGATGLRKFATAFPQYAQEVAAAQRVAVMDARGGMASQPILDCAWLTTTVKNRLSRTLQMVTPQAVTSTPLAQDADAEASVPKGRAAVPGAAAPAARRRTASSEEGADGFGVTALTGTPEAARQAEAWVKSRASQMSVPGSRPMPTSKEDREALITRQIEAVTQSIPSTLPVAGRITLEMEIEPGVWWSIIDFTETQS